jgi:hypothetical protein
LYYKAFVLKRRNSRNRSSRIKKFICSPHFRSSVSNHSHASAFAFVQSTASVSTSFKLRPRYRAPPDMNNSELQRAAQASLRTRVRKQKLNEHAQKTLARAHASPKTKPAHARTQPELQHARPNTLVRAYASPQASLRTRVRRQKCNTHTQTHLHVHAQHHKQACARAYASRNAMSTLKNACMRTHKP